MDPKKIILIVIWYRRARASLTQNCVARLQGKSHQEHHHHLAATGQHYWSTCLSLRRHPATGLLQMNPETPAMDDQSAVNPCINQFISPSINQSLHQSNELDDPFDRSCLYFQVITLTRGNLPLRLPTPCRSGISSSHGNLLRSVEKKVLSRSPQKERQRERAMIKSAAMRKAGMRRQMTE